MNAADRTTGPHVTNVWNDGSHGALPTSQILVELLQSQDVVLPTTATGTMVARADGQMCQHIDIGSPHGDNVKPSVL
jgi:hypothetical protein